MKVEPGFRSMSVASVLALSLMSSTVPVAADERTPQLRSVRMITEAASAGSHLCFDGDQPVPVPRFANQRPTGMTFFIDRASLPIEAGAATTAIRESFKTWNDLIGTNYFTVNDTGGTTTIAAEGVNTVAWIPFGTGRARAGLAFAQVWRDATNKVVEADILFNSQQPWGAFTTCNGELATYEIGNLATHEIGHVLGLSHLRDTTLYPTMWPGAARGEVRKRTLTTGDIAGFNAGL